MSTEKKLSSYGRELLDELKTDRQCFRSGDIAPEQARVVIGGANATSRALHETVNASKFELGKCLVEKS